MLNIRAFDTIEKFNMLSNTHTVVVGVSGGADSTALLHFLSGISKKYKINVVAAHVNHGLRGDESDRDEEFVRSMCDSWGIKLYVKKENIRAMASSLGQGLEECGRNVRYSYFDELAEKNNAKIATAHTLSDSIETVIMNLTRGSGLNGLCGIPPIRDKIIRPFINMSRNDVEGYCRENNIKFIDDSTNFSRDYTRNKIRIDVVSTLKNINPNLDDTFRRFFISITEDNNYFNDICKKELENIRNKFGFSVERLKILPDSIKRRVLLEILRENLNKPPEYKDVENVIKIIDGNIKCISISKDKKISIKDGNLSINFVERNKGKTFYWQYKANTTNILTEAQKTFIIDILNLKEYSDIVKKDISVSKNAFIVDNTDISNVVFRNRRPGDVFSPANRGVTKKVKKLFNEIKVPLSVRDNLPMLANNQEILWICGIGVSEKYKVNKNTNLVAVISER